MVCIVGTLKAYMATKIIIKYFFIDIKKFHCTIQKKKILICSFKKKLIHIWNTQILNMYINIEPRKINAKINLNKPESFFCPWHFVNMLTVPLGSSSSYLQLLFTSAKLLFFFNFFNFWDLQIPLSHAWNVAM